MTVAQLLAALMAMPEEAVVLMEGDGGFSLVTDLDYIASDGPGMPAEVILLPSMDE